MSKNAKKSEHLLIPGLFLLARLLLFLSLSLEGLRGYGDYWNFYHQASLGIPFVDYWTEFPPIFPFLSSLVYQLVGGRQHAYEYLLAFLFSIAQAGSLYYFSRIARQIFAEEQARRREWIYFALLIGLFYGWGYFDPLAVLALMAAIYYLVRYFDIHEPQKSEASASKWTDLKIGVILALGALIKWFPALTLATVWKIRSPRRPLKITVITLGMAALVWGGLYFSSPKMTTASLISQGKKGSWETVWALIDGNLHTGNFGADVDRALPSTIRQMSGASPRIPSWLTLAFFAGLGLWGFLRADLTDKRQAIAFVGFTFAVFLLWSPGYSPQWVLYLLPLTLLVIPDREGVLMAVILVLISLLEWPLLLSRGYFWSLWVLIPLRTFLLIVLGLRFWQGTKMVHPEGLVPDKIG